MTDYNNDDFNNLCVNDLCINDYEFENTAVIRPPEKKNMNLEQRFIFVDTTDTGLVINNDTFTIDFGETLKNVVEIELMSCQMPKNGDGANDTYVNSQGSLINAASLFANGRDTRLQGQSDVIGNIQLGWDDFQNGSQGTLIINYVSDRVRARGIDVLPDVIEEPPLLVDFVYSKEIFYDTSILKLSLET